MTTRYSKRNSLGPGSPTSNFGNNQKKLECDRSEQLRDSIMPSDSQNSAAKRLQRFEDRPSTKVEADESIIDDGVFPPSQES